MSGWYPSVEIELKSWQKLNSYIKYNSKQYLFKVPWNVWKMVLSLTFKVNFIRQKLSEPFQFSFTLKNIVLGACFLLLKILKAFIFKALHFLKSCPFFVSWVLVRDDLSVIFDQLSKLYLGFDAEPEIRILEVI